MSLHLSNRLTDKQMLLLRDLGYLGSMDITVSQAAEIIDELIAERQDDEFKEYIEIDGKRIEVF